MSGGKRKIHLYSEEAFKDALQAIREKQMGLNAASREFGVPRGTLQDRLHGRVPEGPRHMGPPTVLTEDEEKCLVEWCVQLAKCGFPLKKDDLLNTVQNIIKEDKRPNPFKNSRPGKKWYNSFLKRHPSVVHRTAEGLTKGRAVVTEEVIRKWFTNLETYIKENNFSDIFLDPRRVLNGDETSFSLCPKTGKVLAVKGPRNVYQVQRGNEKETITVLLVFSASGEVVHTLVVFPYVKPPLQLIKSVPENWFLGRSESGWMKSDVFYEYAANKVNPWVIENYIQKPVILLVDGHKSHMTMQLSTFCSENGIVLYALPPNTTHIMQPADVSVFKPLKDSWKKTVRDWQNEEQNINTVLTKVKFCPLLQKALQNPCIPETIKSGFKRCGLFPLDPSAVDYSKCIQNRLEYLNRQEVHNLQLNSSSELKREDFDSAQRVIKFIETSLLLRQVDTQIIYEEVESAKQKFSFVTDKSSVSQEFEINGENTIEEGIYSIRDTDGILELDGLELQDLELSDLAVVPDDSLEVRENSGSIFEELQPSCSNVMQENFDNEYGSKEAESNTSVNTTADLPKDHDYCRNQRTPIQDVQVGDAENLRKCSDRFETIRDNHEVQEIEDNQVDRGTDFTETVRPISPSEINDRSSNIGGIIPSISNSNVSPAFHNHLFFVEPFSHEKKVKGEKAPSAISSLKWREFVSNKEKEKQEKESVKIKRMEERKRKREFSTKKLSTANKKSKNKNTENEKKEEVDKANCSDSEDDPHVSYGCEDSEKDKCVDFQVTQKFGRTFANVKPVTIDDVETDSWLVVGLEENERPVAASSSQQRHSRRYYICKVTSKNNEMEQFEGSFLRPKYSKLFNGFVYGHPDVEDIFEFLFNDIVGGLDAPKKYGRGLLRFNISHKSLQ